MHQKAKNAHKLMKERSAQCHRVSGWQVADGSRDHRHGGGGLWINNVHGVCGGVFLWYSSMHAPTAVRTGGFSDVTGISVESDGIGDQAEGYREPCELGVAIVQEDRDRGVLPGPHYPRRVRNKGLRVGIGGCRRTRGAGDMSECGGH